MAQKVKVQCWGPVWSEKVGWWCCWVSRRSGWLLEPLTELKRKDTRRVNGREQGLKYKWFKKKDGEYTRSIQHKTQQGQLSHIWIFAASPANLYKTINFGLFKIFQRRIERTAISLTCLLVCCMLRLQKPTDMVVLYNCCTPVGKYLLQTQN